MPSEEPVMTISNPRPLLGCIADDFTGATDLANMLVRGGMRTVQSSAFPALKWLPGWTPTPW